MNKHLDSLKETLSNLIVAGETMRGLMNHYTDPDRQIDAIERWHAELKIEMQQITYLKNEIKRCLKNQKTET